MVYWAGKQENGRKSSMPEVVVHAVFGREVREHLDSGLAGKIREVP